MAASVFGAGLLLGLSIAAPVGPMGLLCINRTLAGGLAAGLVVATVLHQKLPPEPRTPNWWR